MKKLRKFLTVGVMVLSIIAMSGLTVNTAQAAAQPGDLIKMDGLSSVYYLGNDGKRYVFPSESVYFSWYNDFSGVITIPASELQSYPLGANVTMRPGTKLVKITTDPSVYAVTPNGVLRKIQSEADAIALYGPNWNKMVVDIADAFFTNYTIGTPLNSGEYPAGTLLKNPNNASIYYFDGTNYRMISSEAAFNANRFNMNNVVTTSMTLTASGTAITGAEDLAKPYGATSGSVVTGSGLTVALSASTPAAGNVPQGTSINLLKINLTAANDGNINVSGIKFTAAGLGNASDIDEVTVYNGSTKLASSKDVDSNKVAQINFTNSVVIPAGQTVSLDVRAKISGTGNYALAIEKAADVMSTGATVSGSFPIKGNEVSGVNVTVGGLTIANDGSLSSVKLGDAQATLAKFKATADGVEDITLNAITLKKDSVSTASDSSFENLKLYMDGSLVATSAGINNRYVTFTFTNPVTILKNNNKRFVVKGDVVDGAQKTLVLTLDSTSDVMATGAHYGYSSLIVDSYDSSDSLTIDAGAVSIEKVNAANDKIMRDTTDVEFGTFKITANSGKNIEMSRFRLTLDAVNETATSTAYQFIENVELFNKTTNSVYDLAYEAGTSATSKVYSNTSMGLVLNSGVTYELVVRADVKSTATNQEYTAKIASAYTDSTTQDITLKETGNDTLISDITPNSVSLKKVIVQVPSVTFSKNALSDTYSAVVGASDQEIINFNVKSGESSAIKLTELKFKDVVIDNGTPDSVTNSMVSEFKLWKGSTLLKTVSASQLASEEITFSDLNETIPANTTVVYRVTTSLVKDSNLNGNTLKYRLSGYSAEDTDKGSAVYDVVADDGAGSATASDGVIAATEAGYSSLTSARTLTFVGTGALYVSMDTGDTAVNKDIYSVANATTGSVAALKMRAVNEPIKVTKLTIHGSENLNGIVTELSLYDGTTLVGSTNIISTDSVMDIVGDNLVVPTTAKNYYLKATLAKIGKDATGSLDKDITFAVKSIEAQGYQSGDSLGAADADTVLESGEIGYDDDNDGTITISGTTTGVSKKLGILASRISSVSLPTTVGGTSLATKIYSGQAAIAAIIAVTADASSNTEANGDAIKTFINGFKVKVTGNASSTISTIERIGGTAGAKAGTPITDLESTGVGYSSFTTGITGSDFEVMPGTTAYFLVKVTPTFTETTSGAVSINVSLDNLDHATAVASPALANMANITWKDASTANAKSPLRLGTSTVDGTTISN